MALPESGVLDVATVEHTNDEDGRAGEPRAACHVFFSPTLGEKHKVNYGIAWLAVIIRTKNSKETHPGA